MAVQGGQRPHRQRRWKRPDPNITVPLVLHLRKPHGERPPPLKRRPSEQRHEHTDPTTSSLCEQLSPGAAGRE